MLTAELYAVEMLGHSHSHFDQALNSNHNNGVF